MKSVIHSEVNKKGERFELKANLPGLQAFLKGYAEFQETPEDIANKDLDGWDFQEDSIYSSENAYERSTRHYDDNPDMARMVIDRAADMQKAKDLINTLEDPQIFKEWFDNLRRKANGTLFKNTVHELLGLGTFTRYSEDSYQWSGPVVRLKNIDDYTAEVDYSTWGCVAKY